MKKPDVKNLSCQTPFKRMLSMHLIFEAHAQNPLNDLKRMFSMLFKILSTCSVRALL
jgi:hypothetical protein